MSVSTVEWVGFFALNSLFWKWVISWGGAHWLEGWKSWFLISWFAPLWSAEQIRLYALVIWFFTAVWFAIGLFIPELRDTSFFL